MVSLFLISHILHSTATPFNFKWRDFTFDGSILDEERLGGGSELETHTSVSKVISHIVDDVMKVHPREARIQRDHSVKGYWDYIKVIFAWSTQGDTLTYGECAELLNHLDVLLPNVNHPIHGKISKNGMIKIRFFVQKLPQEAMQLQSGSLTLRAMLYPSRALSRSRVRSTIAQARQMIEARGLNNIVRPPVSEAFEAEGVYFAIELNRQEGETSDPRYRYREVRNLLIQLQTELEVRNRWCAGLGKIDYEDEQLEDKLVGSILLDEDPALEEIQSSGSNLTQSFEI